MRQEEDVLEAYGFVHHIFGRLGDKRLQVHSPLVGAADRQPVADRARKPRRPQRPAVDDDDRLRVIKDEGDLVRIEAMVDRRNYGPQQPGREHRFQERGMVVTEPGDAISSADAEAPETTGQSSDPCRKLGVGEPTLPGDQRNMIPGNRWPPRIPRTDLVVPFGQAHVFRIRTTRTWRCLSVAPGRRRTEPPP